MMRYDDPIEVDRGVYPVDEWAMVIRGIDASRVGRDETLLSQSNGYLGVRGTLSSGQLIHRVATVINRFHETWQIHYSEPAFGYETIGQTMIRVPDATVTEVWVDGQQVLEDPERTTRRLDFGTGVLTQETVARTTEGGSVRVITERFVSLTDRHLMAIRLTVAAASECEVEIRSRLMDMSSPDEEARRSFDPRLMATYESKALNTTQFEATAGRVISGYRTTNSSLGLACGMEHVPDTGHRETEATTDGELAEVVMRFAVRPDRPAVVAKLATYHTGTEGDTEMLVEKVGASLDWAAAAGFAELAEQQATAVESFWAKTDVEIDGGPDLQQAVRWSLFQLHQSSALVDQTGIPAKGLSGDGYEGHYFWDTEIFVMPFLNWTSSSISRSLLESRRDMLQQARLRAEELSLAGALYPWRTINGSGASAYYPAGTAQYHINADIVYALAQYMDVSGDRSMLWDGGLEMAVETARLWVRLGFHDRRGFHIHLVTGPDEYTALINDNTYTNMMARRHLRLVAQWVDELRKEDEARFAKLAASFALEDDEQAEWERAAAAMFVDLDTKLGVTPQDQSFLTKKRWPFETTPSEAYPLMLHYHPLAVYRHQVLKQPDVVMAMYLLEEEFSEDLRRANFDYYEPLTTGDSSLSPGVQSIVAAHIGYLDIAEKYFRRTALMDIADLANNAADGIHLAAVGSTWTALIFGFAGLKSSPEGLSLDPRLPPSWPSLRFRCRYRGVAIQIAVEQRSVVIETSADLDVEVAGQMITAKANQPTTVELG